MKLISQFKNKYNNITYKTYETSNGIKVLHLDNPATVDFDFAIIFKAGSNFENKENVPKGTSHFLEHMLLNPNSTFKSKEEIDKFEQGNKDRPALNINAYTGRKYIYFTGHTNSKGYTRVMDRLESILEFPKRKFNNQIEKERGVILAEKSRKPKKEKDAYLMSLQFLFKGIHDELTYDVLGEKEDILSIDISHLEKYFISRFYSSNCLFTIQSKGNLNKRVIDRLERISKKVKDDTNDIKIKESLKNKFRVGAFYDERANGISVAFIYFDKDTSKIDYKNYAIQYIYGRLLDWLAFDILREKKWLIYDFSIYRVTNLTFNYNLSGFRFVTEKEKINTTLEELHSLLYTKSFLFLKSKKGKEWFDDVLSTYVFPRTTKFNEELAEEVGISLLEHEDLFNSNTAIKEAKKIKIEDIQIYLEKKLKTPPHIWIESDMTKEEMVDLINKSPFKEEIYRV